MAFNDEEQSRGVLPDPGDEVVITGIAGRFPQSINVDDFFANIMDKKDLLSKIPKEWESLSQILPRRIGALSEKQKFDSGFFGFNYHQAQALNPQSRLLLERTVEAVVDAGLHPADLKGTKTGVYLGLFDIAPDIPRLSAPNLGIAGCERSTLPQMIAHYFHVEGPTVCIDSACSSGGYALEHAFWGIRRGKCDNAIVGSVSLLLSYNLTAMQCRLGILDLQGENNVFNERASGYVRSEAVSVVFLQKLKNTKRIYAQILHSKTNADGYKEKGIMHPSGESQQELLRQIYQEVRVNPSEVNYVEAHSTGTKAGDPEEVGAIDAVFCQNRQIPLLVGSVKSNMGHSEPVSALCSIIKVVMGMGINRIPPNINCSNVRRDVSAFRDGRVRVVEDAFELRNEEIVGVNNSGFGGTNVHIILKGMQEGVKPLTPKIDLVCVSGRTKQGIEQLLASIALRCHDHGYQALFRNIFRNDMDVFRYRGFALVLDGKVAQQSFGERPRTRPRLGLNFGGVVRDCVHCFCEIPTFAQILRSVQNCWDLGGWYEKSTYMRSIVLQIALVEILEFLKLPIEFVRSSSTGVIAGAYAEKLITLEQALSMACQYLEQMNGSGRGECVFSSLGEDKRLTLLQCLVRQKNEDTNLVIASLMLDYDTSNVMEVTGTQSLLISLGRLYKLGFNPNISKLYPFDLPIRAPTISPCIQWNHDEDWSIPKSMCHADSGTDVVSILLDSSDEYWKFLRGHVIDGRNLLPGTALLYITLETFLKRARLLMAETVVIFERVKLNRTFILPKNNQIDITVQIFRQTNRFTITDRNELLASGYIKLCRCVCDLPIENIPIATSIERPLRFNSIYRQLNLHQYNYSDQFRGLLEVNSKATQAFVKWNNNWMTFIDHMISISFLKNNFSDLALLTSIDRLGIDPKKHLGTSEMVHSGTFCNITKSSGVEVRGVGFAPIAKRTSPNAPLLEDYKFVPFTGNISESDSIRTCLRVVADNIRGSTVCVVEFAEGDGLSPIVSNLLFEYLVQRKVIVFSSLQFDKIDANTSLVIVSKISMEVLNQISERLQEGAFILVRNSADCLIDHVKQQVIVVLTHKTQTGVVLLLRKQITYVTPRVVCVANDLNWITDLQNAMSNNEKVLLLSERNTCSGVLGLMNSLKLEYNQSTISSVILMDGEIKFDLDGQFFRKQLRKSLLVNVLRNGEWGMYVYFRKELKTVDACENVVGTVQMGSISSFYWSQGPPITEEPQPPGHSLAYVHYTGLNFKDVMVSSGKIRLKSCDESCEYNNFNLGFEFSGKNHSGQRVMGITKEAALANTTLSDNHLSWTIPDEWSLEEGATVPITYCTVIYALIIVGQIRPGQSILIHCGAGGVGQAALNVAAYYNCTIFVTVGSMEKRKILKQLYPSLRDNHIGNSRDSSFEQLIMKETGGKGVDVIVNSLSEEKLYAGLRCLSRGGKFFEIGRYDIVKDSALDIGSTLGNRSFFGVNLDVLFTTLDWRKVQLQSVLRKGIHDGYVKPLPRTVYESDKVEAALTYMATGKHIGKVVVKIRDENPLTVSSKPKFYCKSDKVYILVGGLGGIGLQLSDWLVKRGARKLVLVSRGGVVTDYQNFKIESLEDRGVDIIVSKQNLQTVEECHRLIEESHTLGSIDGIFNLAGVLNDGLFQNQTRERFTSVLIPKLVITKNLDSVSRILCPYLRYFVVFSSIISGRGNIGQSNYGMTNSAMEEICEMRKGDGYTALAVQWGLIGDVGLLEDHDNGSDTPMTLRGMVKQRIASCLQVLDVLLNSDETIVSSCVLAKASDNDSKKVDLIKGIAKFIGLNLQHISLHSPLSQMGMDSIVSVEIMQFLERQFGIFKSIRELRNTTLHQLKQEQMEKEV